jgi:hypothetical protein
MDKPDKDFTLLASFWWAFKLGVGSKNSAELKVPHFTRFTACQVLPSQPIDFIRQPWRPADFRQ